MNKILYVIIPINLLQQAEKKKLFFLNPIRHF